MPDRVLLTTTEGIPGHEIDEAIGLVAAIDSDTERALEQLERYAAERGATAVVAVRLATSATGGAVIASYETIAYGTAVVTHPAGAPS